MSCRNANLLGKPNTGFHSVRLGGVALGDLLLTLAAAIGLSYIPGSPPLTIWIIFLLLGAMLVHAVFCTKTSVNNWLYSGKANIWIFSGIIIVLLVTIIILKSFQK